MNGPTPAASRHAALATLTLMAAGCVSEAQFKEPRPLTPNNLVTRIYDPRNEQLGPHLTNYATLQTEVAYDPNRIASILTSCLSPSLNTLKGLSVTTQAGGSLDLQLNTEGTVSAKIKAAADSMEFTADGTWKIRAVERSNGLTELELIVQVSKVACLNATISIREVRGEAIAPPHRLSDGHRSLIVAVSVKPGPLAKIFNIPGIEIPGGISLTATAGRASELTTFNIATTYELLLRGDSPRQQVDALRQAMTQTGQICATLQFSPIPTPQLTSSLDALPAEAYVANDTRVFLRTSVVLDTWSQLVAVDRGTVYLRGAPPLLISDYVTDQRRSFSTTSLATMPTLPTGSVALVSVASNTLPSGRVVVQDSRTVEPGNFPSEMFTPWDTALRRIEDLFGMSPNSYEFVKISAHEMRGEGPLASSLGNGGTRQVAVFADEFSKGLAIEETVLLRVLYDILGPTHRTANAIHLKYLNVWDDIERLGAAALIPDSSFQPNPRRHQSPHDILYLVANALKGTLPKLIESLPEQERVFAVVALDEVTRTGSSEPLDRIRAIIDPVISAAYQRLQLAPDTALVLRDDYKAGLAERLKESEQAYSFKIFNWGFHRIFGVNIDMIVRQSYPYLATDEALVRTKVDLLIDNPTEAAKLVALLAWRRLNPQEQVIDPSTFEPDQASQSSLMQKLIVDRLPSTPGELYWAVRILMEHNFTAGSHLVVDYLFGSAVSVSADIAKGLPEEFGCEVTEVVRRCRDQLRAALKN